jgi:SAM-dependent methyltransferase
MSAFYEPFLKLIPAGGRILDAGCGSGRDSLAFLRLGYEVVSIDASGEMVKATSDLTGQDARLMKFSDMNFESEFDGIWACASLLHVPRTDLSEVLGRLWTALKLDGVFYLSFKHGDAERIEDGRFFNDMDEPLLLSVVASEERWNLLKAWITDDVRKDRQPGLKWLNALVRRFSSCGETSETVCDELLRPARLWTRSEILSVPSPVPKAPGVYAWYFRSLDMVPGSGCIGCDDFRLLYIGISPSAPPNNLKGPSTQSLRHRLRYHMQGNAEGSTLRLSLGCLLAERLGIELRRVGSGNRLTFSTGETQLSQWLEINTRVAWKVCDCPWNLEEQLISAVDLPLNLDQNCANAFFPALSEVRRSAKARARILPILPR